jgi:GH24 family phage-related lysozyme (muramidase)
LKGTLLAAAQADSSSGIGDIKDLLTLQNGALGSVLMHATAGGLFSVAGGGKFKSGFLAAGFAELAGPVVDKISQSNMYVGLAAAAVTGGLGSVIGGGKFENGAVTGAFVYLFNQAQAHGNPTHISQAGLEKLASDEGEVDHIYDDGNGHPTIGIGHLITSDDEYAADWNGITHDQAISLLRADVIRFETLITNTVTVSLSERQFDALVNFSYNIGERAWTDSTARYWINYGDYWSGGNQMLRWANGDNPRVFPGHFTRLLGDAEVFWPDE